MNSANTASLMNAWSGKVPDDSVLVLQQSLEKIPDDKLASLSSLSLKSPIVGLVLGLLLGGFGADRFYKGDVGLGVLKLFLGWATLFIWTIVDLFLVWKGIKKDNFSKIMQNINYLK